MRKTLAGLALVTASLLTTLSAAPPAAAHHNWPTYAKVITNARYFDRNEVPFYEITVRAHDWRGQFVKGDASLWVNGKFERRKPLMHGWRGFRIDRSDLRNNRTNRIQVRIDPDSPHRRIRTVTRYTVDQVQTRGDKVLDVAMNQLGDAYRYGAAGPNAYDCSGLVVYAFRHALGKSMPHYSGALRNAGRRVYTPRPGDIVWTRGHVSIYAGNGKVVEAASPGTRVRHVRMWQRNPVYVRAW